MLLIQSIEYSKKPVTVGEAFIVRVSIEEILAKWDDLKVVTWNDISSKTWENIKFKKY